MNCTEARELLSIYRELKNDQANATALELHLEHCSLCSRELHHYHLVGQRLHALPSIEPSATAYTRLMQALAKEHMRFLERSSSSDIATPVPDFLEPYLREYHQQATSISTLTAFSSADTHPLPVLNLPPQRRRTAHRPQLAVLGLVATFLMVVMAGGLTSLLLLAKTNQNVPTTGSFNQAQVQQPSQVTTATYTTTTDYSHIVSAIADRHYIYYTAYSNGTIRWMLEQMDIKTRISTPLLTGTNLGTLILLGSANDQLLWLQLDTPKMVSHKHSGSHPTDVQERTWKLYALALPTDGVTNAVKNPIQLLQGTFVADKVPSWVYTPIQGISFAQNALLMAWLDGNGLSHLTRYTFVQQAHTDTTEIATVGDGHILTSPTSTLDGTSLYWAEEWLTADNVLHSNVWSQQTVVVPAQHGKWITQSQTSTFLLRDDEMSFHPQVVTDTLFLLSTNGTWTANTSNTPSPVQATTTVTAMARLTPMATASANMTANTAGPSTLTVTNRVDPTIYLPQIDALVRGTLRAFSTNNSVELKLPLDGNSDGLVAAPQGGNRFLLWQSSNNRVNMFDAQAQLPVNIGATAITQDAKFLAVNGDTAVWFAPAQTDNVGNQSADNGPTITFQMFNWPSKAA